MVKVPLYVACPDPVAGLSAEDLVARVTEKVDTMLRMRLSGNGVLMRFNLSRNTAPTETSAGVCAGVFLWYSLSAAVALRGSVEWQVYRGAVPVTVVKKDAQPAKPHFVV
jgi:hypothetical protein